MSPHFSSLPRVAAIAAAAVAFTALAAFEVSAAPFQRSFSVQRAPVSRSVTVAPRRFVTPRVVIPRISNVPGGLNAVVVPDHKLRPSRNVKVKIKRPTRIKTGDVKPTHPTKPTRPGGPVAGNDTGTRPPGHRPRPPRHPVGPGVIIGTGVAIGTGVVIGTVGPAGAMPPAAMPPGTLGPGGPRGPRGPQSGINIPPSGENRFVKNEVVLQFAGNVSPGAMSQLLARHRLVGVEQQTIGLTNTTYLRARIMDGRPVRTVLRGLAGELASRGGVLRYGQPNYLYRLSQGAADTVEPPQAPAEFTSPADATPPATPVAAAAAALPSKGDPAQYALAKLHLPEAHNLTLGDGVLVAVIDSGVDAGHPELAGVVAATFDALGKTEPPHKHGTAVAGAIAARARLLGVAPAARILAIRAFGMSGATAEATTFAIIKGVEFASRHGARVINMSFAGPSDPGLARELAAAAAKGIVLVAATGNFGPKSPPQYPAADPNVIAVSATDADDRLFRAANRGRHVAVAAPGVDILLPAPNADYWLASGTSFAAAHVSGIAALLLARNPNLSAQSVRRILTETAHDLGAPGRDPQFGAGLADAYRALLAGGQATPPAVPVASGR